MKTDHTDNDKGSVLIIALMTMTILAMISATSLYIATQNTGTGMQTAAWQQALTGAEAGVDAAVRALNETGTSGANAWSNWVQMSQSGTALPTIEPTPASTATPSGAPNSTHYNLLPSSKLGISYPNTEGTTSVNAWVTVDTAGGLSDSNGTWYRIRSTGQATFQSNSVYKRVSNNKWDNDLRNTIVMNRSRKDTSNGNPTLGPTRTIEVILQPLPQGGNFVGMTLANWLEMSGSGTADSFSSPNGQWSSTYRDASNPLLVAQGATDLSHGKFEQNNQTYVYGGMVYSGSTPQNTASAVAGQKSTPDNITIPSTSDPTLSGGSYSWTYQNPWKGTTTSYNWTSGSYTWNSGTLSSTAGSYTTLTASGGNLPTTSGGNSVSSIAVSGSAGSPQLVIINGDFVTNNTFTYTGSGYITVWVKGQIKVQGSGGISQVSGVNVTYIVDGDMTFSGNSTYGYGASNNSGYATNAASTNFVVVGSHTITDSGQAAFTGTIDAPLASATISGSGSYTGAVISSNLTISGQGSFHFDEGLRGSSNPAIGSYAYASWFEDNSDPTRNARDVTSALHAIVY
jgi:hypothetical protein